MKAVCVVAVYTICVLILSFCWPGMHSFLLILQSCTLDVSQGYLSLLALN
jgi:hypothetical protein